MRRRESIADNGNITFGLVILIIGTVWLLKTMGVLIPGWVFTWPMILIAIGVVVLVKHNFQSGGGAVLILVGSYFLLKREFLIPVELEQYLLPVGLILLGIVIMFRRRRRYIWEDFGDWEGKKKAVTEDFSGSQEKSWTQRFTGGGPISGIFNDSSEFIKLEAVFTSVQKRVLSKNFKGGKAFALFGGMEIDLSQADLGEKPVLDVEISFSGLKLILPPHWDVQLDVTNMFAGVEDKRIYPQTTADPGKVLLIKGTVIFGGLEIKSY
jgi:hypothetical protein